MPAPLRRLKVDDAGSGQRLDAWLTAQVPELSRSRIQALISSGDARLDGRLARPSARLRAGQAVSLELPAPRAATPVAEEIPLTIVYEDAQLVVVDKPAGLVVHPGAGNPRGTLVNALLARVHELSGVGGVLRPGIVHRLDKGTSGLMVVAKDDATHGMLSRQFSERSVEKEYLALVRGVPARREATIDAPIGRHPADRKRMSVDARRGRTARSSYRVEEALGGCALLRVRIHTGRTHQIRVHLASIGHPVAGDDAYGAGRGPKAGSLASEQALARLVRPALHAARLVFTHPVSGARIHFESPLPEDLQAVVALLREAARGT